MHFDCVVCQARAAVEPPGEETPVILVMLFSGTSLEDIRRDLCFEHRRRTIEAAKKMGGAA
jgi:hypothetical protein